MAIDDGLGVQTSMLPEQLARPDKKESYAHMQPDPYPPYSNTSQRGQQRSGAGKEQVWPFVLSPTITAIVVSAAVGGGVGSQTHKAPGC